MKKNQVSNSNLLSHFVAAKYLICLITLVAAFTGLAQSLDSPLWRFQGLHVEYGSQQTVIKADSVTLLPDTTINHLSYRCLEVIAIYPSHSCEQAQLAFNLDQYKIQLLGQVAYDLSLPWLKIYAADKAASIRINYDSRQPLQVLALSNLALQQWLPPLLKPIRDNLTAAVSGTAHYDLAENTLEAAHPMAFNNFNYEHTDDLIALGLSGALTFNLNLDEMTLHAEINIDEGETLLKQVYINFAEFPLQIKLKINIFEAPYQVQITAIHNQALNAEAKFTVKQDMSVQDWQLNVAVLDSNIVNKQLINSVLEIYGFTNNRAEGQFSVAAVGYGMQIHQIVTDFLNFSFTNKKRKLEVAELNGRVDWQWQQLSKPSNLQWQSLLLSGLPVGPADMAFNLSEDKFKLYGRHDFPVLDGAIVIERLDIDQFIGEHSSQVRMDAEIEPISMTLITQQLGWPEMAGQFSGQLPGLVKSGNVIRFEGALNLSVFDGTIRVENLSMERLFGVAPVIAADIDMSYLDLEMLTKTFDFGLITGRLSGEVDALRVTNWKVDRMDAKIYSVKTEHTKQTISQKAIENISSLGGIQGAISRTFLRFFEQFKYKKIKLSCKLHNSVCLIGGIDNTARKFTIVEGGGLPKINIVGFAREIDWDIFVNRLLTANYE